MINSFLLTTHALLLGDTESLECVEVDAHVRFHSLVRERDPRLQVIRGFQVQIGTVTGVSIIHSGTYKTY
jgi:hypothetical protein